MGLRSENTMPGHMAPEFRLQNQNESWVELGDVVKNGPAMVVFYPGDFTPVCTKQLCSYQEAFDKFVKFGITVIGISPNNAEAHQKFKSKYGFTFDLLSDPGKEIIKRYGVTSLFLFGGTSRAVFILAKGGRVLYRYVEATPLTHRKPDELLGILDGLRKKGEI